ncbi:hypothetical protein [Acetobacterium sp.]|uniref:hypothetical protein n=1 Tax=Acetobacterium sp. TaxID=1872094 RepID=UPI002F40363D
MSLIGAFIVPHPMLIVPEISWSQEKEIQKTVDAYEEGIRRIAFSKQNIQKAGISLNENNSMERFEVVDTNE